MNNWCLFALEYEPESGFRLDILNIRNKSLFGIDVCKDFLYICILFFTFKIFDNNDFLQMNLN